MSKAKEGEEKRKEGWPGKKRNASLMVAAL